MPRVFQIFGEVGLRDDATAALVRLGTQAEKIGAQIGQSFDKAGERVQQFARKVEDNRGVLEGVARVGTVVGGTISAGFGVAVAAAAGFEAAMNRVEAVGGATRAQLDAMSDAARRMGEDTQFSAVESAEALVFLRQAGLDVEDAITALPGTLDLAAAGQLDLAEAADKATNVLAGLGLSIEELGRVNDVMVRTAQSANTNVSQMAEAMKSAGNIGSTLGLEIEDVAAAIGILGNVGLQGEEAGTALRNAMARLIGPTGEARNILDRLSQSLDGTDFQFTNIVDVVRLFEAEIARGRDQMEVTAEIFDVFGLRAGPAFAALLKQGSGALADLTSTVRDSEGAARDAAEVLLEGLSGAFTQLSSKANSFAISLAEEGGLLDVVTAVTLRIAEVVGAMTDWIREHPILTKVLVGLGVTVAGVSLAVAGLTTGMLLLSGAISALTASTLPGAALALKGLTGAITGASVAAGLLTASLKILLPAALLLALGYLIRDIYRTVDGWIAARREAKRFGTTIAEVEQEAVRSVRTMGDAMDRHLRTRTEQTADALRMAAERNADMVREARMAEEALRKAGEAAKAAGEGVGELGSAVSEAAEEIRRFDLSLLREELSETDRYIQSRIADLQRRAEAAGRRAADAVADTPPLEIPIQPVPPSDDVLQDILRPDLPPPPDFEEQRARGAIERTGTTPLADLREAVLQARQDYETIVELADVGQVGRGDVRRARDQVREAQRELEEAVRGRSGGGFSGTLESLGEFATGSAQSIEGLVQSGIESLFGRRGLFGTTWEERFRAIGEDFTRTIVGSLSRDLASFAANGVKALIGLIGGRGRKGALGRVSDRSDDALGGVRRLFTGIGTSAAGADRELSGLQSSLFGLGGLGGFRLPGLDLGLGDLDLGLDKLGDRIKEVFREVWEFFEDIGRKAWAAIEKVGRAIWVGISTIGRAFWDVMREIGKGTWRLIEAAGKAIWAGIAAVGRAIWAGIEAIARVFWNVMETLGRGIWAGIEAAGKAIWVGISTIGRAFWDVMREIGKGIWRLIAAAGRGIWAGIETVARAFWEAIRTLGEAIWTGIEAIGRGIWEVGKALWNAVKAFWDGIKALGEGIWDGIRMAGISIWEVGKALWNAIKVFWGAVRKLGVSIWETIAGEAAKSVLKALGLVQSAEIGAGLLSGALRAPGGVGGGGGGGLLPILNFVTGVADTVLGFFQRRAANTDLGRIELNTRDIKHALVGIGYENERASRLRTHEFEVEADEIEALRATWEDTAVGNIRQMAVVLTEMGPRISAILGTIHPWFYAQSEEDSTLATKELLLRTDETIIPWMESITAYLGETVTPFLMGFHEIRDASLMRQNEILVHGLEAERMAVEAVRNLQTSNRADTGSIVAAVQAVRTELAAKDFSPVINVNVSGGGGSSGGGGGSSSTGTRRAAEDRRNELSRALGGTRTPGALVA